MGVCDWELFLKVARASRSGFENNPDRDGLATVWTPTAALRALDPCKGSGHFVVTLLERGTRRDTHFYSDLADE